MRTARLRKRPNRRGYAMVLVAIFCTLFVTFMGVAWRQMASTIRTFSSRTNQIPEDQGALMAMAEAMRALEVGSPPANPYTCYTQQVAPAMRNLRFKYPDDKTKFPENPDTYTYQLTFTKVSESPRKYAVSVTRLNETPTVDRLDINQFGANGP